MATDEQPGEASHDGGTIRTYPVDSGYVVADNGGWIPGLYTTREAAVEAARNITTRRTPGSS